MGFKTQVFNLQVPTQTEFDLSPPPPKKKKIISNPKKAIFWFTLIGPVSEPTN